MVDLEEARGKKLDPWFRDQPESRRSANIDGFLQA